MKDLKSKLIKATLCSDELEWILIHYPAHPKSLGFEFYNRKTVVLRYKIQQICAKPGN
jgi:hypothetical protein